MARAKRGILLCYFFAPRFQAEPTLDDTDYLGPDDAIYVSQVGDLGFLWLDDGRLRTLGRKASDSQNWPVPVFRSYEEFRGSWRMVVYSDDDMVHEVSRKRCHPDEVLGLPNDGLAGSEAAEITLAILLDADMRSPALLRPYVEGDWVAIPLRDRTWVPATVSRSQRGMIVIHVFAVVASAPGFDERALDRLSTGAAVWVSRASDAAILDLRWPVTCRPKTWNRAALPMPLSRANSRSRDRLLRIEFHPDDPTAIQQTLRAMDGDEDTLPDFTLRSPSQVESILSTIITELSGNA